ncbi:MAG: hypothetical protein LBP72_01765 [Dysgonamonadaceae bacterium]|jgi:hypothetical protein|nr:hypothetical protein [Dysgonamonadaceae bacterium]
MHSEAVKSIKPVSEHPVQAFYTDKFQLFDAMEVLLNQLSGKCNVIYITSFSISEEFIRKIWKFRQEMDIGKIVVILDGKAAVKISKLLHFASNVFDEVYLTNNHGKVILFDCAIPVAICTSQNQTRGNRKESTIITTDAGCYQSFYDEIQEMIQTGIKL